jgi:hypothetical protein
VTLAKALYSDFVLDYETVACFLQLQEIRLGLINTVKPRVDHLSLGHTAQSAFEKSLRTTDVDISQDSLDSFPVRRCWTMKKLTNTVHSK